MTDLNTRDPEARDIESLYSVGCVFQNQDKKGCILKRSSRHVYVMRCCLTSSLFDFRRVRPVQVAGLSKWRQGGSQCHGRGHVAAGSLRAGVDPSRYCAMFKYVHYWRSCYRSTCFGRFLLVIWKNGRSCWASVTVLLTGAEFEQVISACACFKTLGTFLLIYIFILQW